VLGEHTGIYTLHAVPSLEGLELLAVHPWGGKVLRLRGQKGHAELFAGAEVTFAMLGDHEAKAAAEAAKAEKELLEAVAKGRPVPAPAPAPTPVAPAMPTDPAAEPTPVLRPAFVPAGGMVAALAAEAFTVSSIDVGGAFEGLALSPDGTRIVFAADRAHEVRVMSLEGGASTVIAKTPEARHVEPRFTADGKAVAFTSEFEGNERSEQVGRVVVLGQ
jgi:hypothetical protein